MKNNYLDQWYQSLLSLLISENLSTSKSDRTGTGTRSAFGIQFRHSMKDGFPLLTTKKMAFKTMVTELLWFLKGDTNIKYLVDNGCHIWDGDAYKAYKTKYGYDDINSPLSMGEFITKIKTDNEFAKENGELGPIYGKQWRKWQGWMDLGDDKKGSIWYDQIKRLIHQLKTNPDSRRLMVSAWNVGELDQMVLPPCHYGFQVYTRELSLEERFEIVSKREGMVLEETKYIWGWDTDKETHDDMTLNNIPTRAISLMWNQRSVDTFLGLPFNIASYGLLLEIIAKEVNMVPDQLIGSLGDVHLYNNHIEQAKEQIEREPFPLPTLKFSEWYDNANKENHSHIIFDDWINSLEIGDFTIENYQSHPSIKAPLSN